MTERYAGPRPLSTTEQLKLTGLNGTIQPVYWHLLQKKLNGLPQKHYGVTNTHAVDCETGRDGGVVRVRGRSLASNIIERDTKIEFCRDETYGDVTYVHAVRDVYNLRAAEYDLGFIIDTPQDMGHIGHGELTISPRGFVAVEFNPLSVLHALGQVQKAV